MLDNDSYNAKIRDISKQYLFISENPSLSNSWIGNEARTNLECLDRSVNPTGPNVPLVRSLEKLVR